MEPSEGGFASPYATGGGGTALEHAYGAMLLAELLTSHPVRSLGMEFTPREVRFQQVANCPVDDLAVVGDGPTGSRRLSIGVRHDPTIAGGDDSFVKLLVDYLRVVVDRQVELEADRRRLGLAVAAPHTGAREVDQLAFWARKQPDDVAFRAFIAAPKHTNGKVRARLRHLDNAVEAAAKKAGIAIRTPAESSSLTWRLLKALRIIQLHLEGDDPADATHVVGRLRLLTGDGPRAVALWHRLLHLSKDYAQAAAIVTLDMLARDVSAVVQLDVRPSPTPAGGREQQFQERLQQLPAVHGPRLLTTWRDDQDLAWRLVAAVTDADAHPVEVLQQWQVHRPAWLDAASWQVQLAAGELAATYDAAALAADLFIAAADQGAPRRDVWIAQAAMIYDEHDDAAGRRRALAALGTTATRHPYAGAVVALLSGELDTASLVLSAWAPDQPSDRTLRALLRIRLAGPNAPRGDLTREMLDRALHILSEELQAQWSAGLAATRARVLILRARRGESPNWDGDLLEARALALRSRDARRAYRGDSPEAAALACHASLLLMDPHQVLAIGAPGGDTQSAEAASPLVCEHVAFAAIHLGDLDLAKDRMAGVTDASTRALIDGYLAQAEGRDPGPSWWRAADLADTDEDRAEALLALASVGVDGLGRFPEFAVRHSGEATELQAMAELAAGRPGAALGRLRQRRRSSIPAALSLARAYQQLGNVDDQIQTLRDAADDFNDPSLRHAAAEALTRADRTAEARDELETLLMRTGPAWSGRAAALRLASYLAWRGGEADEVCRLLQTVLDIEPGDDASRWTLVRALLQRGDLNAAWRALHHAPEPLEPTNPTDAQAWVKMHRRLGQPVDMIVGGLRLLRRFADHEQLAVTVLLNLALPWPVPVELPDDVRAQIAAESERFFQRWPDSQYLFRIQTADQDQLRAEMIDMARRGDDERQNWRRLILDLARGTAPLGLVAGMARRSYAEICLFRAGAVLPAYTTDPAEIAACVLAAAGAADHDIIIDTPAITALLNMPAVIRTTAMGRFARVVTADDDVMLDALNAKDTLDLRSTASWRYDEQLDHLILDEVAEAEADRLALEANQLYTAIETLTRLTPPRTRVVSDEHPASVWTWSAPLDLARARGIALWSDDPVLRAVARAEGVPATSTSAVLHHLVTTGVITDDDHEQCVRALIKARIGDFPLNEQRLLEIAEDDRWCPAAVAAALARPATWSNPLRTIAFYETVTAQAGHHSPETLPTWLHAATRGATALLTRPDQAARMAAALLTTTLTATTTQGERARHLVAAARQALADTDHPDQPPAGDPLPAAAVLLRDAVRATTSHELAADYVKATFSALSDADRETAVRALLT